MSSDDEAFFLYCAIVSFQFHPGIKRDGEGRRLTPKEASSYCAQYYSEFCRLRKEGLWLGLAQRSPEVRR